MSILLTGGTGYIGSHIAVELIAAGHRPVIADDLSNSKASVVDRIEKITGSRPAFYEADVCDRAALRRIFDENDIEAVIHLAGLKSVAGSCAEPLRYYRNNLLSAISMLEVMRQYSCKTFVFSSSATVYSAAELPFTELSEAGSCANPYGRSKYMIERIASDAAAAEPELSVVLLRYFNPAGAHPSALIGEDPNGTPNNLMPYITKVASGELSRLRVFGSDYDTPDGTGVRDFIHVVDLARGHIAALDFALAHKGSEIFNLGTGKGCSVLELIRSFEEANGIKIDYDIVERRAGDIAASYADVSKAENILGWRAELGLADMCRDSWNYQKSRVR